MRISKDMLQKLKDVLKDENHEEFEALVNQLKPNNINAQFADGLTELHLAVSNGDVAHATSLINKGANTESLSRGRHL